MMWGSLMQNKINSLARTMTRCLLPYSPHSSYSTYFSNILATYDVVSLTCPKSRALELPNASRIVALLSFWSKLQPVELCSCFNPHFHHGSVIVVLLEDSPLTFVITGLCVSGAVKKEKEIRKPAYVTSYRCNQPRYLI